ncbi:hypothetical protein PBRA_009719 [Plasmodiophora brassicae]|uniref:Uncharacterized protein n=1 Tax=Plasmodiophora brassicae TaxID=37360 RepID=A0A0G4IM65_PLABS|nr:hypothetical protein PBRA_009719 [Plasmodiophora brassicae]
MGDAFAKKSAYSITKTPQSVPLLCIGNRPPARRQVHSTSHGWPVRSRYKSSMYWMTLRPNSVRGGVCLSESYHSTRWSFGWTTIRNQWLASQIGKNMRRTCHPASSSHTTASRAQSRSGSVQASLRDAFRHA